MVLRVESSGPWDVSGCYKAPAGDKGVPIRGALLGRRLVLKLKKLH
jgi:hypothetical protein